MTKCKFSASENILLIPNSQSTFVVRFAFRFQAKFFKRKILLPPSMGDTIRKICFDSIGPYNAFGPIQSSQSNFLLFPIQSNRPDSIRFGPIRSDSFRFRIRFNPIFLLFPIQSNRSGSFGPIRPDSIRFRIRYNAFGPIQIF